MNVTENGETTFCVMANVHVCTIGFSSIHGKELPRQSDFHVSTADLTLKQMFDISAKLVSETR